jgi:hypothetical protein
MKYRKKPVVIDAQQLIVSPTSTNAPEIAVWCGGDTATDPKEGVIGVNISTLEGTMLAMPGDYVIKGVQGEFYPCKPEIFEATYEQV